MSELRIPLMDVTQATATPFVPANQVNVTGLVNLFVEVILDTDGGTLTGTLQFTANTEGVAPFQLTVGGLQQSVAQTGFTYNGSNSLTFASPPAGSPRLLVRFPNQPRFWNVRWTAGGGDTAVYRLRVACWGFGQGCTP